MSDANTAPATVSTLIAQAAEQLRQQNHAAVSRSAQQILAIDPGNSDALYLLGMSAMAMNRPDLAANLIGKAVERQAGRPYYHLNLGLAQSRLGLLAEAEASLWQALALQEDLPEAYVNLGNLSFARNERQQAAAFYHKALTYHSGLESAWYNLGILEQEAGRQQQALAHFARALQADPQNARTHMGRAASLLKQGDYQAGWQAYEWRFRLPDNGPRICPVPRWQGEPLPGKRIYLYTEQGFGDALMFARFIAPLRAMGAITLLECRPELLALFRQSELADRIEAREIGDQQPPPFDYDLHLPLLSLPHLLACTLDNLPATVPYLSVDPAVAARWAARFAADKGFKVGLSWSGNPDATVNHYRACRLTDLLPLLQLPGITFYSLQKGTPAEQLTAALQAEYAIQPLAEALHDFQETAAALQHLDLLISTDTAIVHLAGALGRPVWTLLHSAAEWRWLQERSDTPWYPGMRLFRQTELGAWQQPVRQMVQALADRSR
ncbi:MAG: tetratricopeptide repeat protein [Magnetococcales bacterium]|nr:tetratricopeptide repeat protein [Magnetococcales bacterium]